jgi:hypothetical protein
MSRSILLRFFLPAIVAVTVLGGCAGETSSRCGKLNPTYPKLTLDPRTLWKLPDIDAPVAVKNKVLMCFQHNGPLNSEGMPAYPVIDFIKRQRDRYIFVLRDEGLTDNYFIVFVSKAGEITGSGGIGAFDGQPTRNVGIGWKADIRRAIVCSCNADWGLWRFSCSSQ